VPGRGAEDGRGVATCSKPSERAVLQRLSPPLWGQVSQFDAGEYGELNRERVQNRFRKQSKFRQDVRRSAQAAEKESLAVLASSLRASFTRSKLQSSLLAALRSTPFQQPAWGRSRCWLRRSGPHLREVNSSPRSSPPCDQPLFSSLPWVARGVGLVARGFNARQQPANEAPTESGLRLPSRKRGKRRVQHLSQTQRQVR